MIDKADKAVESPLGKAMMLDELRMHNEMISLHLFCDRRLPRDIEQVRVSVNALRDLCNNPELASEDLRVTLNNIKYGSAWIGSVCPLRPLSDGHQWLG